MPIHSEPKGFDVDPADTLRWNDCRQPELMNGNSRSLLNSACEANQYPVIELIELLTGCLSAAEMIGSQ